MLHDRAEQAVFFLEVEHRFETEDLAVPVATPQNICDRKANVM